MSIANIMTDCHLPLPLSDALALFQQKS